MYTVHRRRCDVTCRRFLPLQIFEKALDEPKYSSLYAQLCRRLHDDAPNFDPPAGSGVTAAAAANSSFSRLLLNKCKDEFENRYKATNEFELKRAANHGKPLTDDEEEQVGGRGLLCRPVVKP